MFPGNGLINAPATTNRRATIEVKLETGFFYVARAYNWDDDVRQKSVKRGPESVKLKNFHR
jgi:hypothetical protein